MGHFTCQIHVAGETLMSVCDNVLSCQLNRQHKSWSLKVKLDLMRFTDKCGRVIANMLCCIQTR